MSRRGCGTRYTVGKPHEDVGFHYETSTTHTCFPSDAKGRKTLAFSCRKLAPGLLYRTVSGGLSGPACRSGVPLEQPTYPKTPAWLRGEVERHSLPRHVLFHCGATGQATGAWPRKQSSFCRFVACRLLLTNWHPHCSLFWRRTRCGFRSSVPLEQPSAIQTRHRAQGESLTLPVLPCTQSLIPNPQSPIPNRDCHPASLERQATSAKRRATPERRHAGAGSWQPLIACRLSLAATAVYEASEPRESRRVSGVGVSHTPPSLPRRTAGSPRRCRPTRGTPPRRRSIHGR